MSSILDRFRFRRRRPGVYVCDASLAQLAVALPPSVYRVVPASRRRIVILDRRHPNLPPVAVAEARRRGGIVVRRLSVDGRTGFAIARFAVTHQF
jgi:hypothetical protein